MRSSGKRYGDGPWYTPPANEPHSVPLAGLMVTTDAGEIDVRRMLERINKRIEALEAALT